MKRRNIRLALNYLISLLPWIFPDLPLGVRLLCAAFLAALAFVYETARPSTLKSLGEYAWLALTSIGVCIATWIMAMWQYLGLTALRTIESQMVAIVTGAGLGLVLGVLVGAPIALLARLTRNDSRSFRRAASLSFWLWCGLSLVSFIGLSLGPNEELTFLTPRTVWVTLDLALFRLPFIVARLILGGGDSPGHPFLSTAYYLVSVILNGVLVIFLMGFGASDSRPPWEKRVTRPAERGA